MSPGPGSDLGPGSAFLSNNPGTGPRAVSHSPVSSPGAISSSARPLNTLAILAFVAYFMTTLEWPIKDIFILVFLVYNHLEGFISSVWDTDQQYSRITSLASLAILPDIPRVSASAPPQPGQTRSAGGGDETLGPSSDWPGPGLERREEGGGTTSAGIYTGIWTHSKGPMYTSPE